jgi:hypothetical protein
MFRSEGRLRPSHDKPDVSTTAAQSEETLSNSPPTSSPRSTPAGVTRSCGIPLVQMTPTPQHFAL